MAIDHDQIFKTLIKTFFREFMELFLPAEAKLIDFTRTEFLEQEVFTDVVKGERKQLDLVAKVWLKKGGEEFILVHDEFQGKKLTEFSRRMFKCYCALFLRYDKLIVPVAVFTDEAVWRKPVPDHFRLELLSSYVDFHYHLIKLKNLDYRKFLKSENPLAYALMAKMNYSRGERVRLKADFLRLILGAKQNPARENLLVQFVDTYMEFDKKEKTEFDRVLTAKPEYRRVKKMMTSWERTGFYRGIRKGREEGVRKGIQKGIEKGIQEGIEKGIQEGEVQGKQDALALQLEQKFGSLSESVRRRISRIRSPERLDSLLRAVLEAKRIEQLEL